MRVNARIQDAAWQRSVILGFVLTIAVFVTAWLWLLLYQFTNSTYDYATNNAEALAESAAVIVSQADRDNLDSLLAEAVEGRGIRLQVFDRDYRVIGDSQNGAGVDAEASSASDVLVPAPELVRASETGTGSDRRLSEESNVEQVYAARICDFQGEDAIVRVATDSRSLSDTLATNQAIGLGLMFGCLLGTALICFASFTLAASAVRRSERVKTQFVANASHELKTPLAGIKLLAESLSRSVEKGKYERLPELADRIDQQTEHLEGIINRLVDISRNDMISEMIEEDADARQSCDFVQAVSDSFSYHGILASDKQLDYSMQVDVSASGPRMVAMTMKQARIVADNLIENAIQYTEKGFVRVAIGLRGKLIVLTVSDSGTGIPKREQGMVFERFYRAKSNSGSNPKGTGLGLSIVRDTVERSGGTVVLTSKDQVGTTVTVSIPVVQPKAKPRL